jgi:hypothetical protein
MILSRAGLFSTVLSFSNNFWKLVVSVCGYSDWDCLFLLDLGAFPPLDLMKTDPVSKTWCSKNSVLDNVQSISIFSVTHHYQRHLDLPMLLKENTSFVYFPMANFHLVEIRSIHDNANIFLDSKGLWWWYITLRVTGILARANLSHWSSDRD